MSIWALPRALSARASQFVVDAAGNKVLYTLDNAGNRIVEQVKDADGALVKNITGSFDALNRLQCSTGVAR